MMKSDAGGRLLASGAEGRVVYRVIIQERLPNALAQPRERRVTLYSDPRSALERVDRLSERGFVAVAERQDDEGWTALPSHELAALADSPLGDAER